MYDYKLELVVEATGPLPNAVKRVRSHFAQVGEEWHLACRSAWATVQLSLNPVY